jgi:phosphocarrier protein
LNASAGPAAIGPVLVAITNKRGLHARASAKFVTLASGFNADVTVSHDGSSVTGTSIMGLMMLAAGLGSLLRVSCEGEDADKAMLEIEQLLASKFHED